MEPGGVEEWNELGRRYDARMRAQSSNRQVAPLGRFGRWFWGGVAVVLLFAVAVFLLIPYAAHAVPTLQAVYGVLPDSWIHPDASVEGLARGVGYWIVTALVGVVLFIALTAARAFVLRRADGGLLWMLLIAALSIVRVVVTLGAVVVAFLMTPVVDRWPPPTGEHAFPPLLVGIVVPVIVLLIGLGSTAAGVAREDSRRVKREGRHGGT